MQPEGRDAEYLRDMLMAARAVERICAGATYDQVMSEEQLQFALVHPIQVVGEAASRLSRAFRQAHLEINWTEIIAQRNVIVHDYTGIDYEVIWGVATVDIPQLIADLEGLLPAENA